MAQEHDISLDIGSYIETIISMRQWHDAQTGDDLIIRFIKSNGSPSFKLKYEHPNYACVAYADGVTDEFRPIGYGYPEKGVQPLNNGYLRSLVENGVTPGTNNTESNHDPSLSHFIAMTSEAARYRIVTAQYVLAIRSGIHMVLFYDLHEKLFKKYKNRRTFSSHMRGDGNHYCSDDGGGPLTAHDVRNYEKTKLDHTQEDLEQFDRWFEDTIKADALLRHHGHTGLACVHGVLKSKRKAFDESEDFRDLLEECGFV